MESFSRTLENYTGSYLAKRRRKRAAIVLAFVASAALLGGIGTATGEIGSSSTGSAANRPISKQRIARRTGRPRNWDVVRSECLASLAARPLDAFYLTFRGLASFYKGMDLPEGEDRAALIDEAIAALRKALATEARLPKAQVEYVLGKAYYDKGRFLFRRIGEIPGAGPRSGYVAADSREYLALAYVALGDKAKAIRNFEAAMEKSRADLLLISAAKAYVDAGESGEGRSPPPRGPGEGQRTTWPRRTAGSCSAIFMAARSDLAKAEEQYSLIIAKDPALGRGPLPAGSWSTRRRETRSRPAPNGARRSR